MAFPEKTERNAEICRRYVAGETFAQITARFGISGSAIRHIVKRMGALGTPEERRARQVEHSRRINADPAIQEAKRVKMRAHYATGRVGPRTPIFAHDPVKREDYLALRIAFGAAYARDAMGLS